MRLPTVNQKRRLLARPAVALASLVFKALVASCGLVGLFPPESQAEVSASQRQQRDAQLTSKYEAYMIAPNGMTVPELRAVLTNAFPADKPITEFIRNPVYE